MLANATYLDITVIPKRARRLTDGEPTSGEIVVIGDREWLIGEGSSYATGHGVEVDEWECRNGHARAYLLREGGSRVEWLFAREVPLDSITTGSGVAFTRCLTHADVPTKLTYREEIYQFEAKSYASYRDVEGQRTAKTVEEYYNPARQSKLSVERWPDGRVECYHERYLSADDVEVRAGGWMKHVRSASAALSALCGRSRA